MAVPGAAALANPVRCIPQFVPTVAMRPWCLSSPVETSQYFAAIATSHRSLLVVVVVVLVAADSAGNLHERSQSQSRRFVRAGTQALQPQGTARRYTIGSPSPQPLRKPAGPS